MSVVLYRIETGLVVAPEDRCSHIALPLSDGWLEGDSVRCLYHGLLFDRGGRCVQMRGQQDIPEGARVRAFPDIEQDGMVWIRAAEPEGA